jgi:hypothetical protein
MSFDDLPPLYAEWLADVLPAGMPRETIATCDRCVMLGDGGFDPRVKCCTYEPRLPNFLVGRILADEPSPGRDSVVARIERRAAVTPLGLQPGASQQLLYEHAGRGQFGKSAALRCPHYLADAGGTCGIWKHRNGVCSTWFCKHVRGALGREAWSAVRGLLTEIEDALSMWCAAEVGLDDEALLDAFDPGRTRAALRADEIDQRPDPDHARRWGAWAGREAEFYAACAERMASQTWADVERIGGARLRLRLDVVRAALRRLAAELPERVSMIPYQVVRGGDRDTVRLVTYSDHDPLEVPRLLLELLPALTDGPVDDALLRIAKEEGVAVDPALVQRLVDFGLLRGA